MARAKLVKGSDLTPAQLAEARRVFTHYTPCPAWPTWEVFVRDHAFYVRKDGKLARVPNRCEPVYMADDKFR